MCCSPWGHKESDTTEQLNNKAGVYGVCVADKKKIPAKTHFAIQYSHFPFYQLNINRIRKPSYLMKQQDEDEYCNKEALLIPRDNHQKIRYNQN